MAAAKAVGDRAGRRGEPVAAAARAGRRDDVAAPDRQSPRPRLHRRQGRDPRRALRTPRVSRSASVRAATRLVRGTRAVAKRGKIDIACSRRSPRIFAQQASLEAAPHDQPPPRPRRRRRSARIRRMGGGRQAAQQSGCGGAHRRSARRIQEARRADLPHPPRGHQAEFVVPAAIPATRSRTRRAKRRARR